MAFRALALWFALSLATVSALATEIAALRVVRADDGVYLSAQVSFELPPPVEEALVKGIALVFVAEAQVLRDRWYWADKEVATTARHMRLSYQPLTRRWRLQSSPAAFGSPGLALSQNFESQAEALAAVKSISRWRIADAGELDPDTRHHVNFRFRLDTSQLPRPFQIGLVGQGEWNITALRNVRLEPVR